MSQERITQLEETVAHLSKVVEELSDVIARQDVELATAQHRIQILMEREAQREAGGTGGIIVGDERPPHY